MTLTDHLTLPDAMAEVIRLRAELAEMTRRRDEWSAKAKGYDALRAAVRARMAQAGSRSFSRVALRGALVESERSLSAARAAWLAFCDATTDTDWFAAVAALDAALGTEGRDHA